MYIYIYIYISTYMRITSYNDMRGRYSVTIASFGGVVHACFWGLKLEVWGEGLNGKKIEFEVWGEGLNG